MTIGKFLRISAVFVLALFFGLGWVGVYEFFASDSQTPARTSIRKHSSIVQDSPEFISIDDKSFTPPQVDETNPAAFDPEGIYTGPAKLSPSFDFFPTILINNKKLDVDCDHESFGSLIKPTGIFFAGTEDDPDAVQFKIETLRISSGILSFRTERIESTAFGFEGKFLVKGNFYTLDPKKKVLKGTLKRFEDGKQVAETDISFTWSIDLTCVC